ncbi:hypothetical protein GGX14DRAFT_400611 [Mycena pura]|uniref:Uncharacterized protein n=1 Tax=Mycena pura TaxID=153505 RepID=A0AAD6V1X2_9AGAR|nr:hypothetical protein GGX14DRAFT_400611 [Mycena pura]
MPPLCRLQRPNIYTSHPSGADANGARVQLLTNVRATCKGACKGRRRQSEAMRGWGADWTTAINSVTCTGVARAWCVRTTVINKQAARMQMVVRLAPRTLHRRKYCRGVAHAYKSVSSVQRAPRGQWRQCYVRAWCLRTTAINIQADAAKFKLMCARLAPARTRAGTDTARMRMLPGCGPRAQKCAQYAKGAQGPAEAMGGRFRMQMFPDAGISGSRPSTLNAGRTDVSGPRPSNIGRRAAPMQTVLGHSGAFAGQAKVRAGCKRRQR